MGPLAHIGSGRAFDVPPLLNVWMDAPLALPVVGQRIANLTHGWPGLAFATLVWGRKGALGWSLHVALDTISHAPGLGSHSKIPRKVWLP